MNTVCPYCRTVVTVEENPEKDSSQLFDKPEWEFTVPCVTPLCGRRANWVRKLGELSKYLHEGYRHEKMVAEDYLRALCGFGPPGKGGPMELTSKMLTTKKVVEVDGYERGNPPRTILRCLTFADGTRMHFAASTYGACIYYIEEANHGGAEGNPSGGATDREKGRRASEDGAKEGSVRPDEAGASELQGPGVPFVQQPDSVLKNRNG